MREEGGELVLDLLPDEVGQRDIDVTAVLPHQLAAGAARRRWLFRLRDDGDRSEFALTGCERGEQGHAFGADRQAVGAILDVAAAIDFSGFGPQCRADFELREWGDGILARRPRFIDQGGHGRGTLPIIVFGDNHGAWSGDVRRSPEAAGERGGGNHRRRTLLFAAPGASARSHRIRAAQPPLFGIRRWQQRAWWMVDPDRA